MLYWEGARHSHKALESTLWMFQGIAEKFYPFISQEVVCQAQMCQPPAFDESKGKNATNIFCEATAC